MTHMSKFALAGLTALALPTLGHAQELLVQGGFEAPNLVSLPTAVGPPFVPGVWGVEQAVRDTGPTNDIIPYKGNWMLKMDDDGLVLTQAFQFVDISTRGNLDTLEVEAWYNSDATAADVRLNLWYFAGANSWGNPISIDGESMILDDVRRTWEGLFYRSSIPGNANWVGVEVAYRNDSIGTDSGFVDNASLVLVPEPASMLALCAGLAALAARRRRRK